VEEHSSDKLGVLLAVFVRKTWGGLSSEQS